jgi:DNA-binding MarR family transcriptional regulator
MINKADTIDDVVADLTAVIQFLRRAHSAPWLSVDITMAQLKALMVTLQEGRCTSRAIAEALDVSPSAVTPLVDKLVQQRLVRREHDAEDRRVVWIVPTEKAKAMHERMTSLGRTNMRALLESLEAADLAVVQKGFAILARAAKKKQEER